MNIFAALIKREYLDGWNGYVRTPVILLGLTIGFVFLSLIGIGEFQISGIDNLKGVSNLGEALAYGNAKDPDNIPAAITFGYWVMSMLAWMVLPFVVFFSLLGSLYEERRDRSILFFKSLPVADWQEVLAKLVTTVVVAPLGFFGIIVAAHLATALLLSIVTLIQGGPVLTLWPLGTMAVAWVSLVAHYLLYALWALPLLAWVLMVSAYAGRMPFMYAVLPPVVAMVAEEVFFDSNHVIEWVGLHAGGWHGIAFSGLDGRTFDGPADVLRFLVSGEASAYIASFASGAFWVGLLVAALFIYATIRLRQRAL